MVTIQNIKRLTIILLLSIFVLPTLLHNDSVLAKTKVKTAHVDIESGVLNVRSGPGTKYKVIGTVKNKEKLTIYSQTKGWSETRVNKKKGYVSNEFLRFYKKMPNAEAKKITDHAIRTQKNIKNDRSYTKKQIKSLLSEGFSSGYTNNIIRYDMEKTGKNKKGDALYSWIAKDTPYYAVWHFQWKTDSYYVPELPKVTYFTKNGKQYLRVKQYIYPEYGDLHQNIYLSKASSKANWKIYKQVW